jgi:hypothetical protein
MLRIKEIEEAAHNTCNSKEEETAFKLGAQWADNNPHWISTKDELPNIGWRVIAHVKRGFQELITVATRTQLRCDGGKSVWLCGYSYFAEEQDVLRWAYLPKLPKSNDKIFIPYPTAARAVGEEVHFPTITTRLPEVHITNPNASRHHITSDGGELTPVWTRLFDEAVNKRAKWFKNRIDADNNKSKQIK